MVGMSVVGTPAGADFVVISIFQSNRTGLGLQNIYETKSDLPIALRPETP